MEDVITPKVASDREHVYHLYVIRTDGRDALKTRLAASDVSTAIHYPKALPFCPAYGYLGHTSRDFPIAYRNQNQILSLPMYAELSDEAIEEVVSQIRTALLLDAETVTSQMSEDTLVTGTYK